MSQPIPEEESPTRRAIRAAAAQLFPATGYAGTTVRDIAGEAGVDPALVIRHFGGKQALFLETVRLELDHAPVLDGPVETMGEAWIRYVLDPGEDVRRVFLALLRASDAEGIGSALREAHDAGFVQPLLPLLEGADAELRARLAGALVGGLLYALWVVGDERLLATDPEAIVRRYGALLQQLLTPRTP